MEALKRSVLELSNVSINAKFQKRLSFHLQTLRYPAILQMCCVSFENKNRKETKLLSITIQKNIQVLIKILMEEIELMELEHRYRNKYVKMEKGHREYYLREQLKIIQTELEKRIFHQKQKIFLKIAESEMPKKSARARIEVDRFKMPPISSEASITYLPGLASGITLNTYTEENLDITKAQRILMKIIMAL